MISVVRELAPERILDQPPAKVERTAFYLPSQDQPLFAWLHHPGQARLNHGVVLCPPLGHEQIHAHVSVRLLADALAEAGFTVLRFDYHGTGDSAGVDEDPERVPTWLANIRDAKAWLQIELGCPRISLIGVRLGASLAMQSADPSIDNLVLWAPVTKGRQYVREMKALGLTAATKPQPLSEAPDDIEAAGFVLTKQTADALSEIDLLACRPQCRHVLIAARADFPDKRLLESLSAQGVAVEQIELAGYAEMMAEPHYAAPPRQAIADTVAWLLQRHGANPTVAETPQPLVCMMREAVIHPEHDVRERLLKIDEEHDLFGILSEPVVRSDDDRPIILLLNGGSAHRVGPNRLYVSLARRLAAQGFRCVRMDFCGLGDSGDPRLQRQRDPFAETSFRDIELALQYLQTHLGAKRVVPMGLCSGAYFAFHAAAQIDNPILVESILINPLTFYWKQGMTLEVPPEKELRRFDYYMKAALKPRNWLKLLTGRTKTGLFEALGILYKRCRRRRPPAVAIAGHEAAAPGHPLVENLPADLDRVVQRGRRLAFFLADADPGYSILTYHAGREVNQLSRAGRLDIAFIKNADHTFSRRVPRRTAVQAIADYLCGRYPHSAVDMATPS